MSATERTNWADIPEAAPDEWDIAMLSAAEKDPDCNQFVSGAEIEL